MQPTVFRVSTRRDSGSGSRHAAGGSSGALDRKVDNSITRKDARNHFVAPVCGYHPGYRCIRDWDRERIVCT